MQSRLGDHAFGGLHALGIQEQTVWNPIWDRKLDDGARQLIFWKGQR